MRKVIHLDFILTRWKVVKKKKQIWWSHIIITLHNKKSKSSRQDPLMFLMLCTASMNWQTKPQSFPHSVPFYVLPTPIIKMYCCLVAVSYSTQCLSLAVVSHHPPVVWLDILEDISSLKSHFIFHSSPTSQAGDTVNSNPWGFRQPEDCDSWSFTLCFRAFLLLMVALAFMSTESSYIIRGALEKTLGNCRPVHISRSAVAPQKERKKRAFSCKSLIRIMAV